MLSAPVLYHAEVSFYSQRARLAFAEKGVKYKSHWVSLMTGETHSLKYLQYVNPKGTVPAIEHLGVFYTDSKDIIEYIDTLPSGKPILCPYDDSEEAKRVRYFQDALESLNVPLISYGSMYHRETLTSNSLVPSCMDWKQINGILEDRCEEMAKLKKEHPEFASTRNFSKFRDMVTDESAVLEVIEQVGEVLEEVEEQLRKQKAQYGDVEYWLCSRTFTIADIYLACLLHRLTYVGQSERLFTSNRPITSDYYQRVLQRETFRRECAYANSTFWSFAVPLARAKIKQSFPFLCIISLVSAGAIVYLYRDSLSEFVAKYMPENTADRVKL